MSNPFSFPVSTSNRLLYFFIIPVGLVYLVWLTYMVSADAWSLFRDGWFMTVTMVAGSFVAGASSEGGGAIAYPVMTLVFDIEPDVARNFSLAIQSIGMTAAALWIFARRIPIETTYLWLAALGGTAGIAVGTFYIAPLVPPAYAKMMFVTFWLSYGLALFTINHIRQRDAFEELPALTTVQKLELVGVGMIGGILSGILGNGLDICSFAFVTLKYRLSEKVATPTSVVLMAFNAIVGFMLHGLALQDMQPEALNYWLVSIPVVVLGAPLGAHVVSRIPRIYIAGALYVIFVVQFVSALLIIRPAGMLVLFSIGVFAFGLVLFFWLTKNGVERCKEAAVAG